MQTPGEINDLGFSPSFSCYSGDNPTSTAAARVSREVNNLQHAAESPEFSDIDEDDFEFSLEFSGEKFTTHDLASEGRILLPIFNTDLVTKDDVDRDDPSAIIPLEKLLLPIDNEDAPSSSSSESDELEDTSSGTFCVTWRKAEVRSLSPSPAPANIRKSRSTGSEDSGSRRWRIKDILRRSNSLGKETVFFLCPKRVEASCKKGHVKSPKVTGKSKAVSSPSIHELFYVQKRAEQQGGKMKSYLPYRQDILGFKVQINGNANKKLPF